MKENEDGMKKEIMPILKEMKVNDVQMWPIERIETVTQTVGRASRRFRAQGMKFATKSEGLNVVVTRIA